MSRGTGTAAASVIVATPWTVDIGGYQVGVLSMCLGLLAVALTRMMLTAREKKPQSRRYNWTVLLLAVVIWFALLLELRPGPGASVAWGSGIGVSVVLLVDIFGERILGMVRAFFGKDPA